MKLPNAERAIVADEKLRDYCLNPEHPRGRHKARVFAAKTGLTVLGVELLRTALLEAAYNGKAVATEKDQYGQRYTIDFMFRGVGGQARVRSCWMVRRNEDFPRLTSCYIL